MCLVQWSTTSILNRWQPPWESTAAHVCSHRPIWSCMLSAVGVQFDITCWIRMAYYYYNYLRQQHHYIYSKYVIMWAITITAVYISTVSIILNLWILKTIHFTEVQRLKCGLTNALKWIPYLTFSFQLIEGLRLHKHDEKKRRKDVSSRRRKTTSARQRRW